MEKLSPKGNENVSLHEAQARIEGMRQFFHSWGNVGDEDDILNGIKQQLESGTITPVEAVTRIEALEKSRNFR